MKIYSFPSSAADKKLAAIENRSIGFKKKDIAAVSRILTDVRKNGDSAVLSYTRKFDAPNMNASAIRVTAEELSDAARSVDRSFMRALNRAVKQIRNFHRRQVQQSWISTDRPGTFLGQLIRPVATAGIYVPGGRGGKTPLVSSVLMGAIPAAIAGVGSILMATPPMQNGAVDPHLLVAAQKAGVHEIYKIGSAWAIAALAYGTETIPKAQVIAGPGNLYVTLAKKLVAGDVGIDMIAGPSEILIVADETAVPAHIAADLLSQAEHDPLASSMLVTPSMQTARDVLAALNRQLKELKRQEIARASLSTYGAVLVVANIETAMALANRIAPEHLELQVQDPFSLVDRIQNAGAVFMGDFTPEPVGDYMAGPNHVLPTAGTARYASALSVDHFIKKTSLLHYSKAAFRREATDIMRLAEIEGLDAHARAVGIRLGKKQT
ncbi:MAG: histidinol dehydrogenase [Deltaproteobacteria bacterium]